ncbi:MAG: BTAD domain-containing putative transcriptional regulator, partial [Actinocrinis sp.]
METLRQGPDLYLITRDGARAAEPPHTLGGAPDSRAAGRGEPPFRILGPLEVHGDEPVAVTARRQEVVLALLLLSANQVVPLETLIHGVWGVSPPTTARAQVQTAVSVLRRSLARAGLGERVRVRGPGYSVEVAPGELDLHVFDGLVARGRAASLAGRPDVARAAFRPALALWRGEPLAGVESDEVQARLVRIADRRVEALEECIEAELQLGLHREVLGEVRALVEEYPLRERPAGQLMLALCRSGRQAEALAVYQQVRRTFVRELGLEPSAELHRLELAILNGSDGNDLHGAGGSGGETPATAVVASLPAPRMLPARTPDFTDHGGALATLCRRLSDGQDGDRIQVAVITGCGGVGKSALAVAAAHALAPEFPDGQLYARLTPGGDGPASAADLLERFLHALGHSGEAVPDNIEGRAALYRSVIADRRLLVVVEDVTDEAQLRALIPGTPTCRLIATSRARLAALPGATVVEIPVPNAHEALRLFAAMVGSERVAAEPSEALDLVERCDRLPLALRAAATRLAARPHWDLAQLTARLADEYRRLDELTQQGLDVRGAFRDSYEALPRPAKLLFGRMGALPAVSLESWVAAPLLDMEPRAAAEVLENLVDARLVEVAEAEGTEVEATAAATGHGPRYRLRDLARLYARERQFTEEPEDDREAAFRRLLGAWLFLLDEAGARLRGSPGGGPAGGVLGGGMFFDGALGGGNGDAARRRLAASASDALLADPAAWYERERGALLAAVRQAARCGESEFCWNLAVAIAAPAAARRRYD